MEDVTKDNFGYIIAFIIPGFLGLWALSLISPIINTWLTMQTSSFVVIKDVVFVILASLGLGVFESTIRWIVFEKMICCRFKQAEPDFSKLKGNLGEFESIVENHYKYHQFYGNCFVVVIFYGIICLIRFSEIISFWSLVLYFVVIIILYVGAKDALLKYQKRVKQLFN